MGEIRARLATGDDAPAVARLFEAYRAYLGYDPAPAEAFLRHLLTQPHGGILVAEADGTIAAFLIVIRTFSTRYQGPALALEDLWVDPAARKAGAGHLLMRSAEAMARQEGCKCLVCLVDDPHLKPFHEALDYRPEPFALWRKVLDGRPNYP